MSVYRVTESFAYPGKDGYTHMCQVGSVVGGDDPVLKGHERYFETVEAAVEHAEARKAGKVEEATAEPGQLRQVSTVEEPEESVKRSPGRPRKV